MFESTLLTRRGLCLDPIIVDFARNDIRQSTQDRPSNQQEKEGCLDRTSQQSIKLHSANKVYTPITNSRVFKNDSSPGSTDMCLTLAPESYQRRLKEIRQFFNDKPLMRCLDTDKDQFLDDVLFENLLKDVKQKMPAEKDAGYRGQLEIRAFWDNVRAQLRDEEYIDDADTLEHWPGWENTINSTEIRVGIEYPKCWEPSQHDAHRVRASEGGFHWTSKQTIPHGYCT